MAELAASVARGDDSAFDELYRRCTGMLFPYLRRALGDGHEAEDVTQTVLMKAREGLRDADRPILEFERWLFTIARNELIRKIDRRRRLTVVETAEINRRRELENSIAPPSLDWLTEPRLIAHVNRLTKFTQGVLALSYLFDLADRDIAALLGTTVRSVCSTRSAAIAGLELGLTDGRNDGRRAIFGALRLPTRLPRGEERSIDVLPPSSRRAPAWRAPGSASGRHL